MGNNSTDELCNAHHHLTLAAELERRAPIPRQDHLRAMQDALRSVELVLTDRIGPPLRPTATERLRAFWPTRSRS